MLAPHALRYGILAGVCLIGARYWQRHGVQAERRDRIEDVEGHLAAGRLQAADELARLLLADFEGDSEVRGLAECARAAMRANELLGARQAAAARELLERLARAHEDVAVVQLLLGRARQQTGDRAGAEAAFARFRELAPQGLRDPKAAAAAPEQDAGR